MKKSNLLKKTRSSNMANITKQKRDEMLAFLEQLKADHNDDASIRAFNEIQKHLTEKKFGLVWEEHTEAVDDKLLTSIPIFCADNEKRIFKDENKPWNFLIEGDNLQALYLLEKTHRGRVDCIYIDPPYNTGNEDFIYNDKYVNSDDVYLHSKWLSFMEKRLKIAYKLLKNDGICFISIDDHEQATLKLLCDQIFGNSSFISNICVETSNGVFGVKAAHTTKTVVKSKDYVLVYAKDPSKLSLKPLYSKSKRNFDTHFTFYKKEDFECTLNEWLISIDLINKRADEIGVKNNISNLDKLMLLFPDVNEFILNNSSDIYRIRDYTLSIDDEYLPDLKQGKKVFIEDNYVYLGDDGKPYYLYPFSRLVNNTDDYESVRCSSVIVGDMWKGFHDDMGNVGKEGGVKLSNGKKPVRLIKNLLKLANKPNAIVLDFFAGSGTTAEAVLNLNSEDGGNRSFILCTDNSLSEKERIKILVKNGCIDKQPRKNSANYEEWENKYNLFILSDEYQKLIKEDEYSQFGICRSITYPRINTVITGKLNNGSYYSDGKNANVKYFKCDWTPRKPEDYLLSNALCLHIREMIELQNHIEIDNKKYVLILNKSDFNKYIMNPDVYADVEKVWVNQSIIFNSEELKLLRAKGFKYIPREYFGQELREAAE